MTRKKWTVYIGDWDCKRCEDCHSEKEFSTSKSCWAFMWAKANCETPEACWVSAGLDGWDSNHHLAGKEFPKDMEKLIKYYIREEDALEAMARGVPLEVSLHPTSNGNFLAYCPKMRCELLIKDVSELDKLCDEYAGLLEAENGGDEGMCNVNLKVSYGKAVTYGD